MTRRCSLLLTHSFVAAVVAFQSPVAVANPRAAARCEASPRERAGLDPGAIRVALVQARAGVAGCDALAQRWLIYGLRQIDRSTGGVLITAKGKPAEPRYADLTTQVAIQQLYAEAFVLFGTPELGRASRAIGTYIATLESKGELSRSDAAGRAKDETRATDAPTPRY